MVSEAGYVPIQGEIIKADVGRGKGHEPMGYRPYICLSNDLLAKHSNMAVFAAISTNERNYPLYIPLEPGLSTEGVVMLDQLVTIDYNARGAEYVETVSEHFLDRLLETVVLIFQKD